MTLDEAREITRIDPNAVGWLSDDDNIIKIVYRERKDVKHVYKKKER